MNKKMEIACSFEAIGTYSPAIKAGNHIYLSGQIPLDPNTLQLISDDFRLQARQVFKNLQGLVKEMGYTLNDIVKLTVYLTNLAHFEVLNEVMLTFFEVPYPARTTIEVASLPKNALIEVDAILVI